MPKNMLDSTCNTTVCHSVSGPASASAAVVATQLTVDASKSRFLFPRKSA